jgi:hypothetical protein
MEPGYVKIINPADGSVAEVAQESMAHHYRAGWRLLTDDEIAAADKSAPEPKPMTKAQAAKAAKAASEEK